MILKSVTTACVCTIGNVERCSPGAQLYVPLEALTTESWRYRHYMYHERNVIT